MFRASRVGHHSQQPSSLVAFRNFEEEMRNPGVWESEQSAASTAESSRDNLASLYRPPFHLMFNGPFDKVNVILILDFVDSVNGGHESSQAEAKHLFLFNFTYVLILSLIFVFNVYTFLVLESNLLFLHTIQFLWSVQNQLHLIRPLIHLALLHI